MKTMRIIDRAAVFCYGCNKVHQLRLIERNGGRVAVVSGREFKFPGNHMNATETFNLGSALVDQFTRADSAECPLKDLTA